MFACPVLTLKHRYLPARKVVNNMLKSRLMAIQIAIAVLLVKSIADTNTNSNKYCNITTSISVVAYCNTNQ